MMHEVEYSRRERRWLWAMAVAGFLPLNGAFVYGALRPDAVASALHNPIAVAFIGEALLLLASLAWLLTKWGVSRLSWRWFVGLSLLAGIAFALPVVLLWHRRGAWRDVDAAPRDP